MEAETAFHNIYVNHPTTFAPVEYHPTWGFDAPDDFGNADSDARAAYYGITMTPGCAFDGSVTSQPYTQYSNIYNQRHNVASPLFIKLVITANGNNFTVKTTITRQGTVASSGLRLHVAVTENNLESNGHTYNHVLRKMYPSPNGTSITINNNQTKTFETSGALNSSWVKNNLHFVVWVQNESTKEIYQAKLAKWSEVGIAPASLGRVKALLK